MVEVINVSKYYGNFLAVNSINFKVEKGEIVAFLGPNGSGKTTTMRIITGFLQPSSGKVTVDGMDVFENDFEVKSITGYLPENPPLYPELTVEEYLSFVAELKRVPQNRIKSKVTEVIEKTALTERRKTLIGSLSKGLKQRVGIAQSIVNDPQLLILDEPTVGLDPLQVIEIRNLVKKLAYEEKRTIILSTHILAEASEICEKAIIINNGNILAVDTIENLKKNLKDVHKVAIEVKRDVEGLKNILSKHPSVLSVVEKDGKLEIESKEDIREEIAKICVEKNSGLLEIYSVKSTLEEIFVKLVQEE